MSRKHNISITVIADECDVSPMTVSRALRNNSSVRETTREKILTAAKRLGYIRDNRIGRPTLHDPRESGNVEIIAGILRKGLAVFHSQLITAIEVQLSAQGYDCIIKTCNGEYEQLLCLQENLRHSTASATMLVGSFQPHHLKNIFEIVPNAILIDNPGDPIIEIPYESFCFDNEEAGRIGVRHLFSINRKKILLVNGVNNHFFSREIEKGYRDSFHVENVDIDESLIINTDFTSEGAYQAVYDVLASGKEFDSVLTNDEMASGVYRAILEKGLKIPDDIAICGCDGIPLGTHLYPRLTTMVLDYQELARKAVHYLLYERKQSQTNYRIKLLPRLEIRESTITEVSGFKNIEYPISNT